MSYLSHIETLFGGARLAADQLQTINSPDGEILEARYDLARMRREVPRDAITCGPATLWRYAPLLPVADPAHAVSLAEGWTPLLPVPGLGRELDCPDLFVKDEGRNPSGTFKDRGASVAVTRLRELGTRDVIHNSSGNAAGSWALYAARAGLHCVNIVPEDVLPASAQQSVLSGADTYVLEGPWQRSGGVVQELAARFGWLNIGTLKEPYRLEGKKTMGYEICEQLGWELPDVVVYPTGGALGALAIFKGFRELIELGWVKADRTPRLVVTQYEGCAPIVEAFHAGADRASLWPSITSPPGGLKSASPPGDRAVLRLLRETGGTAIAVSIAEALDAVGRMARHEGLFPCPEAGTTLAGLQRGLAEGSIGRRERIVLMCTGSGLKSTPILPGADAVRRIRSVADVPAR